MSKLSLIERNKKRIKLYKKYKAKHDKLLKQANNKKLTPEEQFHARLKLSKIPIFTKETNNSVPIIQP